ncbi:DUF3658 domain-containing protein [Rhodoblastus sp.]|uniref:DUF3658 domain-containing protein n=1 Tax=Rhodoblastus sp. TaxID=1962975 RepID=UPI0035B0E8CC
MSLNQAPLIHVVFGQCAAASIEEVLKQIDRHEPVIGLPDDLSFGPINPPSAALRQPWVREWLVRETHDYDYAANARMADSFWEQAMSPNMFPLVWMCRRDAGEYAAFLEFIWRRGDAPFRVIDATNAEFSDRFGRPPKFRPIGLGAVAPETIVASRLLDRQTTLPSKAIEAYREQWTRLKAENASLRIVDGDRLASAPLDYFDNTILSFARNDWQMAARIIGETMAALYFDPPGHRVSDMLLWGRVRALSTAGALEISGDGLTLRGTQVRLPESPT